MPNDIDMILPEGFDPDLGDANFDENGLLVDTPAPASPTTDMPAETETPYATEAQEPTTATEDTQTQTPQGFKVKFNHEERELSYDEAVSYAQKGMNYDKLEEKYRAQEALLGKMNRLASDLEYSSAEEMIDAAANNFIERQVRELVDKGNTEDVARFLVAQRMKEASAAPTQEQTSYAPPQTASNQPQISDQRKAELDEFVRAYPGVTKLPDEVIAANRRGVRLLVAYEQHKNKQAQSELAILKQNQAAAAKAPVRGTVGKATPPDNEKDDVFLQGFEKGFR